MPRIADEKQRFRDIRSDMASLGAWHLATLPHAAASRRTATLPCAPSVHPSSIPARHLVTSVTCAAATPAAGTGNGNGGGPNGARPPRPSNSGYLSFEDSFERRRRQDVEDETEALGDPNFSEKLLKGEQILQSYLSGRVRQVPLLPRPFPGGCCISLLAVTASALVDPNKMMQQDLSCSRTDIASMRIGLSRQSNAPTLASAAKIRTGRRAGGKALSGCAGSGRLHCAHGGGIVRLRLQWGQHHR